MRYLPDQYLLLGVRCESGSVLDDGGFDGFRVVVEYESDGSDPPDAQLWTDSLVEAIRADWPPSTLQIMFQERSAG